MQADPPEPADAGGVYVHFPYCLHRCFYCDFNVVTPRRIPHAEYADAVVAELALRARTLGGPARSLYFGGGTPSLWATDELSRVVEAVRAAPGLRAEAEVTLEANPGDVTAERVAAWRRAGITRVSLGVQALHDALLRGVDRRHDAATALDAVAVVAAAGFASWTLDFMFGLPGQDPAAWRDDLARLAALGAPHLSIYGLTVEAPTPLARLVRDGKVTVGDDAWQAEMLFDGRRLLQDRGYAHYEVSSYARPGHHAVHNAGYWEMRPYLGLGAGAHGFVAPRRWMNVRRVPEYVERARSGADPTGTEEVLDAATLGFERVMTGLRRLDTGLDLGADWPRYEAAIRAQERAGALDVAGTRVRLTDQGLRFMNDVLVALMPDELVA